MTVPQYGPGPVIHGQDITNPNRYIVQHGGGTPQLLTMAEIAALPIHHQWFTGTTNGLIASWWSHEIAASQAEQRGVLLGQILPMNRIAIAEHFKDLDPINADIAVLCDPNGKPLRAEP